jgi:molybdopterin-guanine dinucleotide biosynthesis protein A
MRIGEQRRTFAPCLRPLRTSALKKVESYLSDGQRSLKGFASLIGRREVEWPAEPFDPFFNVNTAEQLAEAERRARG